MNEPGETPAFHNPKTRTLRLQPLPVTALPNHPILAPHQTASSPPTLRAFVAETLNEARAFATTLLPSQFQNKGSPRSSAPSAAPVQLLVSDVLQGADGRPEAWFARRSVHDDASQRGTASWAEFERGLFAAHSVNEAAYTPEVFDAFQVLSWAELLGREDGLEADGWADVAVEVFEMAHKIPAPLENRVFAVVVVRGKVVGSVGGEFVTAQVPVDFADVKEALYSNGRHRKDGATSLKQAKVTVGQYVAVERVFKQDDGKIMWEMATASDAKGKLPMSLQKLGVPGAIIKDVGYFLGWVDGQRKAGKA